MPYELPQLAYPYDALEPHIDEQTMRLHHDKHHAAYVANLNAALEGTTWLELGIDKVLERIAEVDEDIRTAVRNNGGGHSNHSLYWETMSPDGGGEPDGPLADAIADTFGRVEELKLKLNDAGMKQFGSGWTWLVYDDVGLRVLSTPNQDSPWMHDQHPLLGIDVWEHAYYLRYQNRRQEYLDAWWNLVDWQAVGKRYAAALA
jgi:superoxide dismutase, Fe-Mn family